MAEQANKRLKVEAAVLDPGLLTTSKAQRKEIQDKYVSTKPFPHYQIPTLCTREHMNKVHNECVTHLQGNYKETDLFKLYQTIDLGNLKRSDEIAKHLPALLQLRDALYGQEFRQYIQDITGCPKLTEKVDCAANVYMAGCHLLPHDDVISTRCVSYVIYLSDPEDTWTAQDGGQLEIYPEMESNKRVPDLIPTAFALPSYNTMALFTVIPGVSFHSVQEVYADKPRLSIQGWFHQENIPSGVEEATTEQLKVFSALKCRFAELSVDIVQEPQLTKDDVILLKKFINPIYLGKSTIQMIQKSFADNGSLQLHDFLQEDLAEAISIATKAADQRSKLGNGKIPQYKAGYGKQWEPRGPVHLQRYLEYVGKGDDGEEATAGELLAFVKENLFASAPFQKFIWLITGFLPTGVRRQVRRFRAGLDYTLTHKQSTQENTLLDLVLCFVDCESVDAKEAWSSGDVGGFECIMSAEEDGLGDVAKGLEDEDNESIVTVHALNNALNLGLRDENTMKFVKFLSAQAPGSRWDVQAEYEIAQTTHDSCGFALLDMSALEQLDKIIAGLEASLGLAPNQEIAPKAKAKAPKDAKTPKEAKADKPKDKKAAAATTAVEEQAEITKLDIRVGQITKVWKHETADKLYCEEIDVGEDAPRQIASGLVKHYSLEEMQGRMLLVMCNLKPRSLVGFKSHGMVLCAVKTNADGSESVAFVEPPANAKIGERVHYEGLVGEPWTPAQVEKKKVLQAAGEHLKSNEKGVAMWKNHQMLTSGGPCMSPTICNGILR